MGLGSTPLYPWILWVLWTNRNKLIFENKLFSEEDSILKAIQDARAWRAAQTLVKKPSLPQFMVWTPYVPIANSYTWSVFYDAAWDSSTRNCGMGWQLCDANNSIIERSSSHRRFVPSALVVEALAVKAALVAAVSSHVSSINLFSGCKNLISLLHTQGQDVTLKGILHDIAMLASSFTSICFIYIPRLANVRADLLAKEALFSLSSSATLVT